MGKISLKISQKGKSYKVSNHITLGELQSKDGTDTVIYNTDTLNMIEKLRDLTGAIAIINSGYRTSSYNKKIGGASKSTHIDGDACDVYFKGSKYSHKQIACMAQDLGVKGIGYISETGIHLDMANRIYRGNEQHGYSNNVGNDFYSYFGITRGSLPTSSKQGYKGAYPTLPSRGYFKKGDKGTQVKYLQQLLNWLNGDKLVADAILGDATIASVRKFQSNNGLGSDGLFGNSSLKKAKAIKR